MNTVVYARFSSYSQREQSIESQLKTCYKFAADNGYTIIDEYIDRAQRGTNLFFTAIRCLHKTWDAPVRENHVMVRDVFRARGLDWGIIM